MSQDGDSPEPPGRTARDPLGGSVGGVGAVPQAGHMGPAHRARPLGFLLGRWRVLGRARRDLAVF